MSLTHRMRITRFYEPSLAQASFLVGCGATGEAIVIDANRDIDSYIDAARREGLRIVAVTETHIHADYVSGSCALAARTGATLYVSGEGGDDWQYVFAAEPGVRLLRDGDRIRVGCLRLDAIHTPGHTPEHLTFVATDESTSATPPTPELPFAAFTGDFIFAGDVGRPDLLERAAGHAGTMEAASRQLYQSLRRASQWPDSLLLYPGHGAGSACGKRLGSAPVTSVGDERQTNWAFQVHDEETFVEQVLQDQPAPPRYFADMKRVNRIGLPALEASTPPRLAAEALTAEALGAELDASPNATSAAARPRERARQRTRVLDLRSAAVAAGGRIARSLSAPFGPSFLKWAGALLRTDDIVLLVADDEREASEAARALGLIGVDGVTGWVGDDVIDGLRDRGLLTRMATIAAEDLVRAGDKPGLIDGAVLVDVREAEEHRAGHVPGSRSIDVPLARLAEAMSEMGLDAATPLIVYCQGGARSHVAAALLEHLGFTAVRSLSGGFERYARERGRWIAEPT